MEMSVGIAEQQKKLAILGIAWDTRRVASDALSIYTVAVSECVV